MIRIKSNLISPHSRVYIYVIYLFKLVNIYRMNIIILKYLLLLGIIYKSEISSP